MLMAPITRPSATPALLANCFSPEGTRSTERAAYNRVEERKKEELPKATLLAVKRPGRPNPKAPRLPGILAGPAAVPHFPQFFSLVRYSPSRLSGRFCPGHRRYR